MNFPNRPASHLYPPYEEPTGIVRCEECEIDLKSDEERESQLCTSCCKHEDRDDHMCMTCGLYLAEHDACEAEFKYKALKNP